MSENSNTGPSTQQDLIAGLLTIAFALLILFEASHYSFGTLFRMGPGLFPIGLAGLIFILGVALALQSLRRRKAGHAVEIRLRPVVMIGAGVILFALLFERFGIAPATLALVLVSTLAEPQWRPWRALAVAVTMTLFVYVVFILILQMPFAVIRW